MKDYKNDLDKIKASKEKVAETSALMQEANSTKKRGYNIKMIAIPALCVVIVLAMLIPVLNITGVFGRNNESDINNVIIEFSDPLVFDISSPVDNSTNDNTSKAQTNSDNTVVSDEAGKTSLPDVVSEQPKPVVAVKGTPTAPANKLQTSNSYEKLYKNAVLYGSYGVLKNSPEGDLIYDNAEVALQPSKSAEIDDGTSEKDFSDTNNQVAGVQEADVVKTDGNYIYAYSQSKKAVFISKVNNGNNKVVATIKTEINGEYKYSFTEMMLYGDKLVLIFNSYKITEEKTEYGYIYSNYSDQFVIAAVFDITDRSAPKAINTLRQSGYYSSSRMIGNFLYLISDYRPVCYCRFGGAYIGDLEELKPFSAEELDKYVPKLISGNGGSYVEANDILIPEDFEGSNYTVVTGIDVNNPEKHISSKVLTGVNPTIYSSRDNIFLLSVNYSDEFWNSNEIGCADATDIYRLSLSNGIVELKAQGSVPGVPVNQFSADEYNGYLRIATTGDFKTEVNKDESHVEVYSVYILRKTVTKNNLYILNSDMELCGSLLDMAQGERIQSVRFDGEVGYVVTFLQTDPLFTIDLSSPTEPKLLSELKITGFSTYMHPYGDGKLFGFGIAADEGGRQTGLKMTMFDVSDKTDVSVLSDMTLTDDAWSEYSEATYNHKAILVSSSKNIIGIPYASWDYSYKGEYQVLNLRYSFYTYKDGGFKELATIEDQLQFSYDEVRYSIESMRGIYIDDYAYVVTDCGIISINLSTLTVVEKLTF